MGEDYQRRVRAAMERLYQVGPPGHLAAPLAVRWANEDEAFAEDLFFQLLEVLGLPGLGEF